MLRAALGRDEVRKLAADVVPNATVAPTGCYFAVMRLAGCGSPVDRVVLMTLLTDPDPDVLVAAANALLAIDARAATKISATQPG